MSSSNGGFKPMAAPNYIPPQPGQGVQPAPVPVAPATQPSLPFTRVNSTKDPRVLWEDSKIAIIFAGDFPANTGMGRSKSRKTLPDALAAQIDTNLQTGVGAGSASDLVKVYLADLLARPVGAPVKVAPVPTGRLAHSPDVFRAPPPSIAKSGTYKGMVIPDFPHQCSACGGRMYQGMINSVHDTPDGRCPKESGNPKKRR